MPLEVVERKRNRIEKTKESLKHHFSDQEILEMSRSMARDNQELSAIEEAQKKAVADYKAQIQAKENTIQDLSRRINNGYEYRMIECELRYHTPEKGMAQLVRLDSGEVVRERRMETHELQEVLFE